MRRKRQASCAFLLNGKAWLRRVIQPQKFIEAL